MTKRKGQPNKENFENNGWLSWLVIGAFILAGSWFVNQRSVRPSASERLGGHSNGFYGRHIKDEFAAPSPGDFTSNVATPIRYALTVPASQKYIKLVFRYRCITECVSLWLDIPTVSQQIPIRLLLQHDVLRYFRYPSISEQGMTLFQKHITYSSVSAFLLHPPATGAVYTEGSLVQLFPALAKNHYLLEEAFDSVTEPDYILTSYLKPRLFPDEWYEFGRIIDIRGAERTKEGAIQVGIFGGPGDVSLDITEPVLTLVN